MLSVTYPVHLKTIANQRGRWRKAKTAKEQRRQAWVQLSAFGGVNPTVLRAHHAERTGLTITLTRIAPNKLDPGNYQGSFKHVQDGVADWLGIDDGDERLTWSYAQERGGAREYAVRIEIREREACS